MNSFFLIFALYIHSILLDPATPSHPILSSFVHRRCHSFIALGLLCTCRFVFVFTSLDILSVAAQFLSVSAVSPGPDLRTAGGRGYCKDDLYIIWNSSNRNLSISFENLTCKYNSLEPELSCADE